MEKLFLMSRSLRLLRQSFYLMNIFMCSFFSEQQFIIINASFSRLFSLLVLYFFLSKNKNVLHLCFQNLKSYGSRNILRVQNFPLFYFVRFWIWIWICDATCDLSGLGLFCSIWCLRTFSFAPKRAGREVLSRNPTFADFSSSKSLKYKTSTLTIKLACNALILEGNDWSNLNS